MSEHAAATKIRVIHVITDLDSGGAELAMTRLATNSQAQAELSMMVVCLGRRGPLADRLVSAGVPVESLNIASWIHLPRAAWRFWRLLGRVRPSLVQCWLYHSDLFGGVLARLRGIPVVWGVRTTSLGIGNARSTPMIRWLCARLSGLVPSAIVFVAQAAQRSHEAIGYRPRMARVIPNGLSPRSEEWLHAQRAAFRRAHAIGDDETVIGWVGRYNPDKDVPNFLRAMARVQSARARTRVAMVGRGLDAQASAMLPLLATLSATERARLLLLGERRDVDVCYAGFDLFVLSSRTEAFPNVLAEAMSAGLACVSTDVGDTAELLGDTGLRVQPQNSDALACAVIRLLDDPASRQVLGEAARLRILQLYSMQNCVQRYVETYRQVLGIDTLLSSSNS